jgi:SpoVK/Ycf46/Vps4 family AAA+-type ATPase
VQRLEGTTVFLLSGRALPLIGMVTELARELQPSASCSRTSTWSPRTAATATGRARAVRAARRHGRRGRDADLLFLLTTNRADLLEPALAARPGRVDVAVEIDLPDADARRRLFDVYSRGCRWPVGRTTSRRSSSAPRA